ncbi:MAG: caspase family protein [Deltaproteobacteria bacterium]|nr:caspase family protein [Deltaproteobacteria bacterium]
MRRTLLSLALLPSLALAGVPDVIERHQTGAVARADAAVVIGIEDYAFLPDVPFALRDAEAFYSFLVYTRGVPPTRVSLLSRSPTAKEMRQAIEEAASQVGPEGTLWIYFAGHGAAHPSTGDRLLLGVDMQGKAGSLEEDAYAVSVAEIDRLAERSQAADAVVMVDSCYSGTGRSGEALLDGKRFAVPVHAAAPVPKVVHWFATSADELSGPYRAAEHGLFTYFAVGALRGWADGELDGQKDGRVTLAEAQQYTYGAVRTMGGGEQLPTREDRAPLQGAVMSSGREAGPDLAELTLSKIKAPIPVAAGTAVIQTGGNDYLAKLEELRRIKEEREAAEAREATLLAAVDAERGRRIEAARAALFREATQAWGATTPFLSTPSEEARMAVQAFLDTYGAAAISIDDQHVPVQIPEVQEARVWMAEANRQAYAAPVVSAPAAPNREVPPWVQNTSWDGGYAALRATPRPDDGFSRKLFKKADAAGGDDEAIGDLADKAADRGNGLTAQLLYMEAMEQDPDDSEWSGKLIGLVEGDQALAVLVRSIRLEPTSDERHGDLGDVAEARGQRAWACYEWGRAHDLDSADSEWTRKLDQSCGGSGQAVAAVSAPVSSGGSSGSLVDQIRAAGLGTQAAGLQREPSNDELWGDAGDALQEAGRTSLAMEVYLYALSLDDDDGEWAAKALNLGAGERLVSILASTASRYPSSDEVVGNYGDALAGAGHRAEACAQWARAQQLDPADSEWQRKVGECSGSAQSAAPSYTPPSSGSRQPAEVLAAASSRVSAQVQAVRGDAANDELWGDLGDAASDAGEQGIARDAWLIALQLDPDDTEWPDKLVRLGGGSEVVTLTERAVQLMPSSDEHWGNHGDALATVGRISEACGAWSRAHELDGDDSEWSRKLGERCGGAPASQQVVSAAVPEDEDGLKAQAAQLLARGDRAGALDRYQRALALNPSSSELQYRVIGLSRTSREAVLRRYAGSNDEVWGDLGDYAFDMARWSDAADGWRRAHQLDPGDGEWSRKLALVVTPGSSEAEALLSEARVKAAADAGDEPTGDLGDLLGWFGQWDAACRSWSEAGRRDPGDSEWQGKIERCVSTSTLEQRWGSGHSDDVAGALGYIALGRGDRSAAATWFTRALDADPSDDEWRRRVMLLTGQTLLQVLERLAVSSSNDELIGDMGDQLVNHSRWAEASQTWKRALSLDPGDSEWTWKATVLD